MKGGKNVNPKSQSARIVEVIEIKTPAGKGTKENPNRVITEYWSLGGELLAVNDPEVTPCEPQPSPH